MLLQDKRSLVKNCHVDKFKKSVSRIARTLVDRIVECHMWWTKGETKTIHHALGHHQVLMKYLVDKSRMAQNEGSVLT